MLVNIVSVAVIVLILGLALGYIVKSKKSGNKCIGCSHGKCSVGGSENCCINCADKHE